MTDRKIVGYQPIYEPLPGQIVTHAFIVCSICGGAISGSMGPRDGCVCLRCLNDGARVLGVVFTSVGPKGTGVADEPSDS